MTAPGRPDITSLLEADLRHLAPLLRRGDHGRLTDAAVTLTQQICVGADPRVHVDEYRRQRARALRRVLPPLSSPATGRTGS